MYGVRASVDPRIKPKDDARDVENDARDVENDARDVEGDARGVEGDAGWLVHHVFHHNLNTQGTSGESTRPC